MARYRKMPARERALPGTYETAPTYMRYERLPLEVPPSDIYLWYNDEPVSNVRHTLWEKAPLESRFLHLMRMPVQSLFWPSEVAVTDA